MKYYPSRVQTLTILIVLTTIGGILPSSLQAVNSTQQHELSNNQRKRLVRQQKKITKRLYKIKKKRADGNKILPLLAVLSLILLITIGIIITGIIPTSLPVGLLFFYISCGIGYLLSRKSPKASARKSGRLLLIAVIIVNLLGVGLMLYASFFDFD